MWRAEIRVIPLLWCLWNIFDKALNSQFWRKLMKTDFSWCIIEFTVIWLCFVPFKMPYCQRTYTSCTYFDTIIRFNDIYHLLITLLNRNFISHSIVVVWLIPRYRDLFFFLNETLRSLHTLFWFWKNIRPSDAHSDLFHTFFLFCKDIFLLNSRVCSGVTRS